MPVRVTLDPHPDQAFGGRIVRIAPYVEDMKEQSRTFEIEVELDDADFAKTLLPGATADVEVILESKEDTLRVPTYSLVEGERVLLVRADELESIAVETGLRNWEFVEVKSGVTAGDLIVVSLDREEVKEGARVRVEGETMR